MKAQYEEMRKKAGISEVLDNSDGSDYETEQVFKQLRPNAGYKLMDILSGRIKEPKKKLFKRRSQKSQQLPLHEQQRQPPNKNIQN